MVYDNGAILVAHFQGGKSQAPHSTQNLNVFVTVQSCSGQSSCLPAQTLKEEVHVKTRQRSIYLFVAIGGSNIGGHT